MKNKLLYFSIISLGFPVIVSANSALPAVSRLIQGVATGLIAILTGLMPIVAIEAIVFQSVLKNLKRLHYFFTSLVVNLVSTFIGVLLGLFMAKSENSFYYSSYSLIESIGSFGWFALFLFINFLLSVFVENFIARILFKEMDKRLVLKAVFMANLITYLLLFLFVPLYYWIVNFK